MSDTLQRGKVKNINIDKGYGFLTCEDNRDRFFHRTQMDPPGAVGYALFDGLAKGDEVEFVADDLNPKGLRAVSVRRAT